MPNTTKITSTVFIANCTYLPDIAQFVSDAAQAAGLDEPAVCAIQTAVDEACANIIEHAYQGREDGTIECQCIDDDEALTIVLSDQGMPFEPEIIPKPDLSSSLEDRQIGGLGLYFMRALMDEVRFSFTPPVAGQPGVNVVTMAKRKEKPR